MSGSNPLAFIVEDDANLSLIYTEAVKEAGYEVESFTNGRDALNRLALAAPHLVVLDLHLPQITGPEILQNIRSDDRLKDIKVIVVSADDRLALGDDISNQSTLVLLKPVHFAQLMRLAQRLL